MVETARARQLMQAIEEVGATGYTVISNVSGMGHQGKRGEGEVLGVFYNMLIIVIATEEVAIQIVEQCQALLENDTGIVYLSDVEVVRDTHF